MRKLAMVHLRLVNDFTSHITRMPRLSLDKTHLFRILIIYVAVQHFFLTLAAQSHI